MATVKQVLAAISQDGTLGPNQKRFVVQAIERASLYIGIKQARPHKITNAKNLMTLEDWEDRQGRRLCGDMFVEWARTLELDFGALAQMIDEFRSEMLAKGKQYANFKMAFQTYLTKGYLSKKVSDCVKRDHSGTIINSKGINL